ncbi:Putative Zinc finger C2H2-type [Septoria linicola]|uniref:Zinc finger C2H2-type n=1 Tax=Septoria linicola TaxID=215465 RepID=A0A9Q9ELV4_9PEZI|nr:putative Zinc finger C2H2-type [Septoria linicola]USW54764.1 Putative Zinc finger C2H2-type [Septoria linicola]
MVDAVQRGGMAPHMLNDHDGGLDFGPGFVSYDFSSNAFTDVNAESASLQKFLHADVHEITNLTPGPSSRATSYLTDNGSEIQKQPWIPQQSGLRPDTTTAAVDYDANSEYLIENYIHEDVYDDTHTASPIVANPAPPVARCTNVQFPHTTMQSRAVAEPVYHVPTFGAELLPVTSTDRQGPHSANPAALVRALSKRDRQDTSGTMGGNLARQRSKRHKSLEGGFACEGCEETFDRACDRSKHFKRTHAGEESRPHRCPECSLMGKVKAFLYPKDVRRHQKQVHKIDTVNVSPAVPSDTSEPTTPTSPNASALWTLTKAVQRFKNLRISSTSPTTNARQEKFIMVSTNKHNFVDVDVTGITAPEALTSKILNALNVGATGNHELFAQSYSRRHGLGEKVSRKALLDLVNRLADSESSLKLFVQLHRKPAPAVAPADIEFRMLPH